MSTGTTLLTTFSGQDRPGVTAAVFTTLARWRVEVLDIEQIVARGHLTLAVLIGVEESDLRDVETALRGLGSELAMEVNLSHGAPERLNDSVDRLTVTVMGAPLSAQAMAAVARIVVDHAVNIDRIRRIAAYPVTAIVFEGTGARVDELRSSLASHAMELGVDIAVQRGASTRRGQLLIVMDVDSTLIQDEVIDLLARAAGKEAEVTAITELAMRGDIDFAESLRQRVSTLRGLPAGVIEEVRAQVRLSPGAAVRSAADAAVNVPYLDSVLYLLGITRDEVEALSP